MKTTDKTILALLALGASASLLIAQDNAGQQPPDGNSPPRRGPGMSGQRMPMPPVIAALDANHDGTIDAEEIANASAALKKLDKNGDGKLTAEELRPPRPEGQRNPRGQNGPGGQAGSSGQGGQGGESDDGRPPRGPQSDD